MLQFLRSTAPWGVVLLLLSEIVLIGSCYLMAHFLLVEGDPWVVLLYDIGAAPTVLAVLSVLLTFYFLDLYTYVRVESLAWLAQQLTLGMGLTFLTQAVVGYVARDLILPRWIMFAGTALSFVCVGAWRSIYSQFILPMVSSERVLLFGREHFLHDVADYLKSHPGYGASPVGYCSPEESAAMTEAAGTWHGPCLPLLPQLSQLKVNRLILDPESMHRPELTSELIEARVRGIAVEEVDAAYERLFGRVLVRDGAPADALLAGRLGPSDAAHRLQLLLSGLIAVIGTVLSLPLMLGTALAVRLTSSGPVLFRQVRLGLNGQPFEILKFRSMYVGSDRMTAPRKGDPRITPVGHWIRKLRLDELPQFFNVLRGDMLIVGPRPELPEFTDILTQKLPLYKYRLLVKPGITGWAQIHHKQEYDIEDTRRKLGYDLYYMKNVSLALDLYVIVSTAKTMLLSRGSR